MPTIPQKDLRNNVGEVLRRAQAGERFTITVAGRPVAQLGPGPKRHWVTGQELRDVFRPPAPQGILEDLEQLDAALGDPFA